MEQKGIEAVSRLRASEDVRYNNLFDSLISFINLNLLDAPLRNGYIFQFKPFELNEWAMVHKLQARIESIVAPQNNILLCPMGIGNHIDHAICVEAVAELYHGSLNVLFYEDLPYAARITEKEIKMHVNKLEKRLGVTLDHEILSTQNCKVDKEVAIRVYESQMNDDICAEILTHLKNVAGERIWGEANLLKKLRDGMKCD